MKNTISCNMHDHFEIVCMRQSNVVLDLNNGQVIHGKALNIINSQGREYLVVRNQEEELEVDLTTINALKIPEEKIFVDLKSQS